MKKANLLLTLAVAMTLSTAAHAVNATAGDYAKTSKLILKAARLHIPELSLQDQARALIYLDSVRPFDSHEEIQAYVRKIEKEYPNLYVQMSKELDKMNPVKAEDKAALNLAKLEVKKIEPLNSKTEELIRKLQKSQASRGGSVEPTVLSEAQMLKVSSSTTNDSNQIPAGTFKPVKAGGTSSNAK